MHIADDPIDNAEYYTSSATRVDLQKQQELSKWLIGSTAATNRTAAITIASPHAMTPSMTTLTGISTIV
jgi:hypothetical protein